MREHIYTIPINDLFEPREGCPFCRMRDLLEERCVEYIMGAAMMEPDVRVETNRLGFCRDHLEMMRGRKNRLSLALMLSTRLDEIRSGRFEKKPDFKRAKPSEPTCYVCGKIEEVSAGMIDNVLKLYETDPAFRALFAAQETVCLPHYELLAARAGKKLSKKTLPLFERELNRLTGEYLKALAEDVKFFTTRFDYRFGGSEAEWGNSKDSIERAIWFLTSRR